MQTVAHVRRCKVCAVFKSVFAYRYDVCQNDFFQFAVIFEHICRHCLHCFGGNKFRKQVSVGVDVAVCRPFGESFRRQAECVKIGYMYGNVFRKRQSAQLNYSPSQRYIGKACAVGKCVVVYVLHAVAHNNGGKFCGVLEHRGNPPRCVVANFQILQVRGKNCLTRTSQFSAYYS